VGNCSNERMTWVGLERSGGMILGGIDRQRSWDWVGVQGCGRESSNDHMAWSSWLVGVYQGSTYEGGALGRRPVVMLVATG
jgi:hypothetical protein